MAHQGKKWTPSKADIDFVYECSSKGIPIMKISEGLHLDYNTLHKYLREHPGLSEAQKKGEEEFNRGLPRNMPQVTNSLLKNALGYEYEEVVRKQKGKVIKGAVLEDGDVEIIRTIKHVRASDAAIFFFLCNKDNMGTGTWVNPLKVEPATAENKGEIMKWIEEMKAPTDKSEKKK